MRVSTQIATIVVLGGLAAAGWHFLAKPSPQPAATAGAGPGRRGPGGPRGGPGGPLVVEVTEVTRGSVAETAEAVGTTRAFESIVLTAKVSGIVEKIAFREGQDVAAGDDLVVMDAAERRAELEAARAQIATAQAQRQETLQKLERAQALRRSGAGTEAQVADLTLQLRTSETNIAASEARERAAAARLDDLVVRAPFAGRVGLRQVSVGALVDNKTTITTLDDVSRIRLDFAVPEALIGRIAAGARIVSESIAYPGRKFAGEVAVIDTRIDPVTRSAKLTALIDNRAGDLKPGMFLTVTLKVDIRENAILVPEEAVVAEGPQQVAFVVKDGKIDRRIVRIGQRQEGKVEVLEGLAVGETLVVRGVQRVRQGAPVRTRPAFPQAGAQPPGAPGRS